MERGNRTRTLAYIGAAIALTVVVWGIAHWAVLGERQRTFARSAERAGQLAEFFERHSLGRFRYADTYVRMIRRTFVAQHGNVEALRNVMREIPLDASIVSHITVIDENGTPLFVSGHDIKPGTTARDRDYFIYQRDHPGDNVQVSLPHRGRNSGKLIVRLVRRMEKPDGSFGGVVFAALSAENITEFFSALRLGPKSSATLVGTDKRIRARSSYGRLGPGQDISGSRIWQELAQSRTGLYRQSSVVDGVTRYYAYRQLDEFPLIVAIGVATEDIRRAVDQFQLPAYLTALLATAIIIAVTVVLSREVLTSEKLKASEDALEQRMAVRTAELEAVQQTLLRKERLATLGQLTGTVAHELRNPLTTITTSASIIERKIQRSGLHLDAILERVRRNVDRCNTIITELLDFARAKGLDPRTTVVDDWLAATLGELRLPPPVSLRTELDTQGITLAIDRDRVRRAIINLVENARDALTHGDAASASAEITVRTRKRAGRVEIEVSDNGPGVPEELLGQIREPLFSTKSFGVGLGLAVVGQIMDDHDGGLEIESEAGVGTRVVLWLPTGSTSTDERST